MFPDVCVHVYMYMMCFFQTKEVDAKTGAYVRFATNSSWGKFIFIDLDPIMDWIYYLTVVQEWKKRRLYFFILKPAIGGDLRRDSVCFCSFVCRSATATNKASSPGFRELSFAAEIKQTFLSSLYQVLCSFHIPVITQIDCPSHFWVLAQIVTMHASIQQPPQYSSSSEQYSMYREWPFPLWISIFNKSLYSLKWKQRAVHINT